MTTRKTRLEEAYQLSHTGLKALTEAIMSLRVPGYDLEHRLPVAKGGCNAPYNFCFLESSVNRRKGATPFWDYDIPQDAVIRWQDLIPNWRDYLSL